MSFQPQQHLFAGTLTSVEGNSVRIVTMDLTAFVRLDELDDQTIASGLFEPKDRCQCWFCDDLVSSQISLRQLEAAHSHIQLGNL
jgi:hypothetical protein